MRDQRDNMTIDLFEAFAESIREGFSYPATEGHLQRPSGAWFHQCPARLHDDAAVFGGATVTASERRL